MKKADFETAERRAVFLVALGEQMESPETPEVRRTYERLRAEGHSDEETREMMASLLSVYVWHISRQEPYTYRDYVAAMERLPEIDWGEEE